MKNVYKKLKSRRGFTLTEVLIAVLILVLITAGIMPVAVSAYRNAVDAANARVLLSTTVNALRDELSTAWAIKSVDSTTITYQSADTGSQTKMFIKDSAVIMLQEYNDYDPDRWLDSDASKPGKPGERALVPGAMARTTQDFKKSMTAVYSAVSYNSTNQYIVISGLEVKRGDKVLAKMSGNLIIRPLGGDNG